MPASSIVDLVMHIEFIASLGAFLVFDSLASYYSFAISRASIDPTYRRRARSTGALAAVLLVLALTAILSGSPTNPGIATELVLIVTFATVAVWTDSVIRTAIDQDFFHRDTLHWSVARYPFLVFIGIVVPLNVAGFLGTGIVNDVTSIITIALIAEGILALFLSGKRTKDKSQRSYLKWLGLATLGLFLQFSFPMSFPYSLVSGIPIAFAVFFLFKSARISHSDRQIRWKRRG